MLGATITRSVAYPQAHVADLHRGQELVLTGRVLP